MWWKRILLEADVQYLYRTDTSADRTRQGENEDLHGTEKNRRMWRPNKDDKDNTSGLNVNSEFTKCQQHKLKAIKLFHNAW